MNGGAVIDTDGFDITIGQPLLHSPGATTDGLTKSGTGILTLSGINTYRGNTTVSEGTLALAAAADPLNANPGNDLSTVTIEPGAILDLTYTGTDKVNQLFIGVTAMPEGVYGKSGSALPVIGIPEITGDGTLSVVPVFAKWITRTFANGAVPLDQRGADDDFDNDGISNLIEYALAGQDPTVANPTISTFSAGTLGFTKRPEAIGLTYAIQESTDLGVADDWTEVSGGSYVNNTGSISYTVTPGSPARNFIRLEVTSAP
jgi:autotransporter-associated beta strand protein